MQIAVHLAARTVRSWRPVRVVVAILLSGCACVWAAPASAAPAGTGDPAFGAGGIASLGTSPGSAVAILPINGQIVVVGSDQNEKQVVLRALTPAGAVVLGYGSSVPIARAGLTDQSTSSAVYDPVTSQTVVFASFATPHEYQSELLGFNAAGQLDPTFGDAGRLALPGEINSGAMAVAADGTLLVATENADPDNYGGLTLSRVSPDGAILSTSTPVDRLDDAAPAVVLPQADGSTLVAGGSAVVDFDSTGALDPNFGNDGAVHVGADSEIGAAALLGNGDVLLAGSHLLSYSRSGNQPANAMLAEMTLGGHVKPDFGHVGRGVSTVSALSAVGVDGAQIIASTPSGQVASFRASDGSPDITFGIGGVSPSLRLGPGYAAPLAITGDDALTATVLDVSGVLLTGSGISAPAARQRVTVAPAAGTVKVKVPISTAEQPLTSPISATLPVSHVNMGEEGIYTPPATSVDARGGAAQITAHGGRVIARGVRLTLRRAQSAVATLQLGLAHHGCVSSATLAVRGRFVIVAGKSKVTTTSARARLRIRPCNTRDPVTVLSGRIQTVG